MQVTGCWWIYVLKKTTTTKHNKLHLTSLIIMLFYIYGSEIFPVDFISQVLFRAAKNEVKLLIMFAVLNLYGSSYRKKKLKKKRVITNARVLVGRAVRKYRKYLLPKIS